MSRMTIKDGDEHESDLGQLDVPEMCRGRPLRQVNQAPSVST